MKEHRINTMIIFCAFTITLSTLASASSHKIKFCRDVCVKNERYVLLQKGIVYFACHRPNHDHGDAGETQRISRSNQILETNAGLQCAKTRNSVLTNSIMKAHVNMGKMVQDAVNTANRNPSQISHDQQTGRTIRLLSNSQSRVNVQTQDAKGMKTREGGVNETKPSSPLRKSQDQDTKNEGTERQRMNETTRSLDINHDTKSNKTERRRVNETTRSSPKHSGVPNQDTKSKRTERGRMNETTRSVVPNHDAKSKGIARGRINETTRSSTIRSGVLNHDTKSKGIARGRMNETTRSSTTRSGVLNHDTKSKGIARGRMNETTRSSTIRSGVLNHDTKSKGIARGRMNETTRSVVLNHDTKSKGIARGRMYYTKPISPSRKSAIKQDSKRRGTERGRMNETTRNGVLNHDTKSKGTERGRINETTLSSTTHSGVLNHDTKSKGIARGRMYYTKPSSPSRKSAIKQVSKRRGTERGRMNESSTSPSQGIGIHSQNITRKEPDHLGINATVLKKQAQKLDLTVTKTISKSQPSVVMPKQGVNGKKTGDDNVHQTKQIVPPSPVGYQKMTVGKRAFLVKKYAAKKTWQKALEKCRSDGGTLVKPDTRLKSRSLIKKYAFFKSHWIGLKDVYDNDTFFWTDGSPVTFSKWQIGQPSLRDLDGKKENCVDLSVNFFKGQGWNDQRCDKPYQFICEM